MFIIILEQTVYFFVRHRYIDLSFYPINIQLCFAQAIPVLVFCVMCVCVFSPQFLLMWYHSGFVIVPLVCPQKARKVTVGRTIISFYQGGI